MTYTSRVQRASRRRRASPAAILLVIVALGFGHTWLALWILPLGFLVGLVFGAFGLAMNALAPGYDFFTYFFTLIITPMLLLSGVYFPVDQMPGWLASAASVLPLKHAIDIARPLMLGRVPDGIVLHVAVLAVYAVGAYYVALVLTRRRLLEPALLVDRTRHCRSCGGAHLHYLDVCPHCSSIHIDQPPGMLLAAR